MWEVAGVGLHSAHIVQESAPQPPPTASNKRNKYTLNAVRGNLFSWRWAQWCPKNFETEVNNKCLIVASWWFFSLRTATYFVLYRPHSTPQEKYFIYKQFSIYNHLNDVCNIAHKKIFDALLKLQKPQNKPNHPAPTNTPTSHQADNGPSQIRTTGNLFPTRKDQTNSGNIQQCRRHHHTAGTSKYAHTVNNTVSLL